jgi:hypothetical protein
MVVCLVEMTVRTDLMGVTSLVRALGLLSVCYGRILDLLHSHALHLETLTRLWCGVVCTQPGILSVDGRPVLIGDGMGVAKSGKKIPGVVAMLMHAASSVFAVPLACRIHEGPVFCNRDRRTLLDKMILLIDSLSMAETRC